MLETAVIITIIVCTTTLVGYLFKLIFMSKCTDCNCFGIKVHRQTEQEAQTVSNMRLPISGHQ
jgi:hypothetical protein